MAALGGTGHKDLWMASTTRAQASRTPVARELQSLYPVGRDFPSRRAVPPAVVPLARGARWPHFASGGLAPDRGFSHEHLHYRGSNNGRFIRGTAGPRIHTTVGGRRDERRQFSRCSDPTVEIRCSRANTI